MSWLLKVQRGTCLVVQWLGLHALTAECLNSIPGRGTKIPQAARCGQKKKEEKKDAENLTGRHRSQPCPMGLALKPEVSSAPSTVSSCCPTPQASLGRPRPLSGSHTPYFLWEVQVPSFQKKASFGTFNQQGYRGGPGGRGHARAWGRV